MNKAMQTNATGIDTVTLIRLASKYAADCEMASSARLCLKDAAAMYVIGNHDGARMSAVRSLSYSVGILGDLRALAGAL